MMNKKMPYIDCRPVLFISLLSIILFFIPCDVQAESLYSPTWGFSIYLPEDYTFIEGDGRDRFSFSTADGAMLDLIVYYGQPGRPNPYQSVDVLADNIQRLLVSSGDVSPFDYQDKEAALFDLYFANPADGRTPMSGWGLAVELAENQNFNTPKLLALAYGPAQRYDLQMLHLSVLDTIAPEQEDKLYPGPITEFAYPRQTLKQYALYNLDETAWFYAEDEEASQALIDREFEILKRYAGSDFWAEAWKRFYRVIYRDSYGRITDAASAIVQNMGTTAVDERDFAGKVLDWVQTFDYERNLLGSDFLNLVSAILDGRGDCDNRAMLWAIVLNHSGIPAGIMVSREYSHAMGLAYIDGAGARLRAEGIDWLVAETTVPVDIGRIEQNMSDSELWIGILF